MNEILTKLTLELRPEILLRVFAALVAGLVLGIRFDKQTGNMKMRTSLLISLASCFMMIIIDSLYAQSLAQIGNTITWILAPSLLVTLTVLSVGIIGAAAILFRSKRLNNDTTTSITLWFTSIIGLCFGAGVLSIGILATFITIFILLLIPHPEVVIQADAILNPVPPSRKKRASKADSKKLEISDAKIVADSDIKEAKKEGSPKDNIYVLNDKHADLQNFGRHISLNQIFPSDLKHNRSTTKLKRVKTRRLIAYMY